MKFIFLVGGLVGFLTAAITGWAADRSADSILLDAMLGALVGAILFRWFWKIVLKGIRETFIARRTAEAAQREAEATAHAAAQPADPRKRNTI